uniref:Uncharacterized protein n=1 Tax=viral metagenome TaxID=1070528 RepID=A0A6C0E6U5_9ZZZZ
MLTSVSTNTQKCSTEIRSYIDNSIKRSLQEYKVNTAADEVVLKEIRKQIKLEKEREREKQKEKEKGGHDDQFSHPYPCDPSFYIKWSTIIGITCLLIYKSGSLAK